MLLPGLAQRVKGSSVAVNCGVGCRCGVGSDLTLLWLWCRPTATARIRPLAWENSYATGAALKRQKIKNKIKKKFPGPEIFKVPCSFGQSESSSLCYSPSPQWFLGDGGGELAVPFLPPASVAPSPSTRCGCIQLPSSSD